MKFERKIPSYIKRAKKDGLFLGFIYLLVFLSIFTLAIRQTFESRNNSASIGTIDERSTNWSDTPFSFFATTMAWVAISASGTAILEPFNKLFSHRDDMLDEEGALNSSVTAKVPTTSPDTSLGKISFFMSSLA